MTDVNYFDNPNAETANRTKSSGWLGLVAGLGIVAIGFYAFLRGKNTANANNSGGGYSESLAGGSGDGSLNPELPVLPNVPQLPGGSATAGGSFDTSSGSALSTFAESYGAKSSSVANVLSLSNYGNETVNYDLGVKYQNYLNTEKTQVTNAAGNVVSLGSDLNPVLGLGKTIYFLQEKGEGLPGTPDSNALAASGLLGGAIAGVSQEQAPFAVATSIAKWFDSPYMKDSSKVNQAASMGLSWSPQTGLTQRSTVSAQSQTQVTAAIQTNAVTAAKQQEAKAAAAALAAQQAAALAAQQAAALAAQQAAQAAKSSGSSAGSTGSSGSSGSGSGSAASAFFNQYIPKSASGGSGSGGGAVPTAAGGKTTTGSGGSSSSGSSGSASYNNRSGSMSGWSSTASGTKVH
ncbi:hypothetical protein [Methanorbis furvi]|uniref:Uncharacterized protein n=1 Tax=Methanorbis furvi TaxID=3028299 RepID=A0AAE4SAZ4_9EURY|nr:hypothetical protein [Methanocorpusculaceae archaeon Ag1]